MTRFWWGISFEMTFSVRGAQVTERERGRCCRGLAFACDFGASGRCIDFQVRIDVIEGGVIQ